MLNINLKDGLVINAILTGVTGLGLALFAELSATYLMPGAPVWLIAALGIALVEIRVGTAGRLRLRGGSALSHRRPGNPDADAVSLHGPRDCSKPCGHGSRCLFRRR